MSGDIHNVYFSCFSINISSPRILEVNLKPMVNICKLAARKMINSGKSGSIVNVSSNASLAAFEGYASYSASKSAMDQVTKVMALEFGQHNVSHILINKEN